MLQLMALNRTVVINVVGLTKSLLGEYTPCISAYLERCDLTSFKPEFPAVTCSAQSTYLTGVSPSEHGIVGNGWYDRDYSEVFFWKQSNRLVNAPKVWDRLRTEYNDFTCANMFWWYNMYSTVDFSCTPRPIYRASGAKFFDVHTQPMGMREELKADLGDFPFPQFWGPMAGIGSSQWIADSAKWVEERESPTLNFIYLPHLDYCLQQYGPDGESIPAELGAIDKVVGDLIDFYSGRNVQVALLSEYGISRVGRVIHLNRVFREKGWLEIKDEMGCERMECGSCRVFAVADHQVAHIYIQDESIRDEVKVLLQELDGVEEVRENVWQGLGAERGGDLVAVANEDAWFTYYFWNDDDRAPDFARSIDIHRKPGYDPAEMFIDPELAAPKLKMAMFLLKKKLGFRAMMDIIPLEASMVRGSHGRDNVVEGEQPIWAAPKGGAKVNAATDVQEAIYQLVVS